MNAAAPWSVKGIDPKAREIAKDLARRSGMTLGEWLNTMIMEDDEDGVAPFPRRPSPAETQDRWARSRRLNEALGASGDVLQQMLASADAIAARLEAAERRSTIAIQGIDQAVTGLMRRFDAQDETVAAQGSRIDDIAAGLRQGTQRLRRFEQDGGPLASEILGKVESAVEAVADRLYELDARHGGEVDELRQRMGAIESVTGLGSGSDMLSQVGARLDAAQGETSEALRSLERAFAGLDQRLRATEAGGGATTQFEAMAESFSRQIESNRLEMIRRLDTAEADSRMARIEQAVLSISEQARTAERDSAKAVETMGREVLRIAQNLDGRMRAVEGGETLERLSRALGDKVERDMSRLTEVVTRRLISSDDQQALAIEKLGGEITRISDRLADRIAQSERRSAQALDDIGDRLTRSSEKTEQRQDRACEDLAERMRQSEERTARLLADARESLAQRSAGLRSEPPTRPDASSDWRAAAFLDAFTVPEPVDSDTAETTITAADWSAFYVRPYDSDVAVTSDERLDDPPAADDFDKAFRVDPSPPLIGPFGAVDGVSDSDDAFESPTSEEPGLEADDGFEAQTEFVAPGAFRADVADRSTSTRDTIEAARAAMAIPNMERDQQPFARGGKSRLQQDLDKQASRSVSTVKKTLVASMIAATVVASLVLAQDRILGIAEDLGLDPALFGGRETPLVTVALSPNMTALDVASAPPAGASLDAPAIDAAVAGFADIVSAETGDEAPSAAEEFDLGGGEPSPTSLRP